MGSAYSIGSRIALDYCYDDEKQLNKIKKSINNVISEFADDVPSLSTHFLQTDSTTWESVIKADPFFKTVKHVLIEEEFIKMIMKDRVLKGLDIAKYILAKLPCTHLKLEKLVYMSYADYLCETGEKLFDDKIYSYSYGPVIDSVYKKFRKSGADIIEDTEIYSKEEKILPIRSRIMSSKDGLKKLSSIDRTLKKYGELSAEKLVNLTHKPSSPWQKSGAGEYVNKEISDDVIIRYHCNEIC